MRRPLSGALLGLVLGLAIAVVLQQLGIWPLDRVAVFLLPAFFGLLGILLVSLGRVGSTGTLIVALVITIPLAVWGALGLGDLGETGQLNGGCTVNATSDIDSTTVTDTTRGDPFRIEPQGGLNWAATSPSVFDNYRWEIWTEVGGFKYTLAAESDQNNDSGSQTNRGDVSNVTEYGNSRNVAMDQISGVIIIGGDAADACDGFGFVSLEADPFSTLISQIALAIAVLAVIVLLLVIFVGRGAEVAAASTSAAAGPGTGDDMTGPTATAAGIAAGLAAADEAGDPSQDLTDDMKDAAEEYGSGPSDDSAEKR
jgi:hypothetical protein